MIMLQPCRAAVHTECAQHTAALHGAEHLLWHSSAQQFTADTAGGEVSASKRKGTAWESTIVTYLRGCGVDHAERRALNGARDRGDIAGIPGVVIEGKSAARTELAVWVDEAEAERVNDGALFGVVWHKRRGKSSAGDGYVTMTGATFVALLRAAGYVR